MNDRLKHPVFKKVATAVLSLIVIGVIAFVFIVFIAEDEATAPLTIDQQLTKDLETFAEATERFNGGGRPLNLEPETINEFTRLYLPEDFTDPRTDEPYSATTQIPAIGDIQYIIGGICNADDSISQTSDQQNFAVRSLLSQNDTLLCIDTFSD